METTRTKIGLLRPFRRNGAADFATGTGDELLTSKVGQLLGIDGELPWAPELTSKLNQLRHARSSVLLQEYARIYVGDVLKRHMPSVRVLSVVATREDRRVRLRVIFARAEGSTAQPLVSETLIPES